MLHSREAVAQRPKACNFIKKESLAQVFFYEFCEISKNIFFYRTPPLAASDSIEILITKNILFMKLNQNNKLWLQFHLWSTLMNL